VGPEMAEVREEEALHNRCSAPCACLQECKVLFTERAILPHVASLSLSLSLSSTAAITCRESTWIMWRAGMHRTE
jgi:hypothetical protein